MPRYGRDFSRSRFEEELPDRGYRGREGSDFGGRWGMRGEGRRYSGFNEDSVDELSGFGPGGGGYDEDYETGYRGGYGGPGMGGYMAGGFGGRGYEGREERDLGGYERGYSGGQRGSWGGRTGGYGARGFGREERGYESFGESRPRGERWGGERGGRGMGGGDELRRMRAADIMTENPECVTPDVSLADAARKMRDLDVGIIPVVESEGSRRLRGVITDRDIAIRAVADGRDASTTRVSEVMTTRVETCNKNDPVQNVLRVMEREQVRRVPITDREGRLVGIIAQADVALDLDDDRAERRVVDTIERISEPTRGDRGMQAGSATRGRTSLGRETRTGTQGETGGGESNAGENL
jgi:CBS domain-containing protein